MLEKIKTIRPSIFLLGVVFVLNIFVICAYIFVNVESYMYESDAKVYYLASRTLIAGNIKQIYNTDFQTDTQQNYFNDGRDTLLFINTPVSILLFAPLSVLDYSTYYKVLLLINTALFLISLYILYRDLELNFAYTFVFNIFIVIFLAFFQNQLSVFIFFLYVLIIVNLWKNPWLAGVLSGLLFLKPQHLLLVPFSLVLTKKKTPFIISAAVTILSLVFINYWMYGFDVYNDYLKFTFYGRELSLVQEEKYQSFNIFSFNKLTDVWLGYDLSRFSTYALQIFLLVCSLIGLYKKGLTKLTLSHTVLAALLLNLHTKVPDLLPIIISVSLLFSVVDWKKFYLQRHFYYSLTLIVTPMFYITKSYYIGAFFCLVVTYLLLVEKQN